MGVKLREKPLKGGGVSFYLDISHSGRRWYQFLDIKANGSRRRPEFVSQKKLAEKARDTKQYQLSVEKNQLPDESKSDTDFLAFVAERSTTLRSNRTYEYLCRLLQKYTGSEVLPMSEINKEFLIGFQDFLKKSELSNGTIYNVVHRCSTFINKAIEAELMNENPYAKIPKGLRVRLRAPTPKYLTLEQIELLASKSKGVPEQLKQAFFLSCFSGLRWSDCSRLKWNQITKHRMEGEEISVLYLEQLKTKQGVHLPISEQAQQILEQRKKQAAKETPSPYVFPELYEPEGKTRVQFRIIREIKNWGKQAGLERVHFHLARHTFATLTLSEGADLYTVSKLLGHTDIKNTQIYAHVVDRLKMQAVARLPMLSVNFSGDTGKKGKKAG